MEGKATNSLPLRLTWLGDEFVKEDIRFLVGHTFPALLTKCI